MPQYLLYTTAYGYIFRRRIPLDLRAIFGRQEVKRVLRTHDEALAIKNTALLSAKCTVAFRQLREELMAKSNFPYSPTMVIDGVNKLPDGTIIVGRIETDPKYSAEETKAVIETLRELGITQAASLAAAASTTPAASASSPTLPQTDQKTLKTLIEDYRKERLARNRWTEKSASEHGACCALLCEIIGDKYIHEITREDATAVLSVLQKLPPNRNKKPLYRTKSLQQILDMQPAKTLSVQSVNKHMVVASSLFKWARENGYINRNSFSDLKLEKEERDEEERSAYITAELKQLLADDNHKLPYQNWIAKIGLYTGMREDEICQLYKEDIRQYHDIWVFDINRKADKKTKTKSSVRLVPVHPKLIEYGILKFHADCQGERLFPELEKGRDGYGQAASKWFNRRLKAIELNRERLDFHSLRHTFATELRGKQVPENIVAVILGHETHGITFGRYGNRYTREILVPLKEAIEKADFGLDTRSISEAAIELSE